MYSMGTWCALLQGLAELLSYHRGYEADVKNKIKYQLAPLPSGLHSTRLVLRIRRTHIGCLSDYTVSGVVGVDVRRVEFFLKLRVQR